ncbi:sensor histidine kinase [Nonomuraea rhodomycinica]|uniref:Histidine kinase n=1 Tax=Nonomuraea rhodomycinica TaxID=1712872 RepID=A0A7Y6ILP8_9ACTN|nr:histidine kinase [Nonomuraea rhodomycinica]NUW40574.1 hypothetical protein [Nonomuraea rhodomycinica]
MLTVIGAGAGPVPLEARTSAGGPARALPTVIALTAAGGSITGSVLESGVPVPLSQGLFIAAGMPLPLLAWLIATRRPDNRFGRLLLAVALCFGMGGLGAGYLLRFGVTAPGAGLALVAAALFGVHYGLVWIFVPLLFPDGRLPSPRWRPLAWIGGLCIAVRALGVLFAPGAVDHGVPAANPLALPGAAGSAASAMAVAGTVATPVIAACALGSLAFRRRSAPPAERLPLRWLAGGVLLNAAGFVAILVAGDGNAYWSGLAVLSLLGAVPAALGVALVRHRLLDIRVVVRGSFAYGTLWAAIALLYVTVATVFGVVAGERLPVAVAVALAVLITLVFQPIRARLETLADRLVFGARPSAAQVLAQAGTVLDSLTESGGQLQHLAHVARSALGTTWVLVELDDGTRADAGTVAGEPARTAPIRSEGAEVGRLSCGPKTDGRFADRDDALLPALAAQAGLALRAARLAARLVHAQEGERKRIERNIHDGVQQQIVALIAGLETARALPHRPETLLHLREQARAILEDLRELAAGIYPTALVQGGLAEAVEERCARLPLTVRLAVDDDLRGRRLPGDVEGAAYFTISESLANVLKHADATRVEVRLALDAGRLVVTVSDDGVGFDHRTAALRGLGALADRLSALGGGFDVVSAFGEGTRVSAWTPIDD